MSEKEKQYRRISGSGASVEGPWFSMGDGDVSIKTYGATTIEIRNKPEQCTALSPFDVDGIKLRCEKEAHGWGDRHRHDFEFSEHHTVDYDDNDCFHTIEW